LKSNYISTELRENAKGELIFEDMDGDNRSDGSAPDAWHDLDAQFEIPPLESLSLGTRDEDGLFEPGRSSLVWRDAPAGMTEVDEVHDVLMTPRSAIED